MRHLYESLSPRLRRHKEEGQNEGTREGRGAVKCCPLDMEYIHELIAAGRTHTQSSQQDQWTFQQAALTGLSATTKKERT